MLHVRFEGRSYDLDPKKLAIVVGMNDREIKSRVAQHLDVGQRRLDSYVIDRPSSGELILRPEAIYG